MLAEAKSRDPWTSRARPSFLYVIYLMILAAIPMGIVYAVNPTFAQNITTGVEAWLQAIPESLWWLFGAGYLGYTGAREFGKKKTVGGFIDNLLVPFLYRFSYIQKYNEEPFPDRAHGLKGIIDFYIQEFNCNNFDAVINFLIVLSKKKIRGHHRCPCGSGKLIRNCHKKKIDELSKFPKKIFKNDLRQFQIALQSINQNDL